MKILLPKIRKEPLPRGKVSVRYVHSRNMYQVYVAGCYLYGASGGTEEEALENMRVAYEVPK